MSFGPRKEMDKIFCTLFCLAEVCKKHVLNTDDKETLACVGTYCYIIIMKCDNEPAFKRYFKVQCILFKMSFI